MTTQQRELHLRATCLARCELMDVSEQFDLLPYDVQDKLRVEWPKTLAQDEIYELAHSMLECDTEPSARYLSSWLAFLEGKDLYGRYGDRMVDELMARSDVD